jgi:hypothetical protein
MAEKKQGVLSKIFTGGYTVLLVVLMIFAFIYLAFAPDFVEPDASGEIDENVWNYSFDEFEDYMIQLGYFKKDDYKEMSTIGTISRIYNGIDVMWWDVDNLEENTLPYKYWHEFQENGYTLDFGNTVYMPQFNGPFAINATSVFPGNTTQLYDDFLAFPANYTPSSASS